MAWSSPESLASTLSPRYRSLFGNQPPDVCQGDGFPNVCRGGNVLARRNYPCANFVGSFFGSRRTTCGPVAHHPRWWRTSTPHNTSLHHCTCAASPAPYLVVKNSASDRGGSPVAQRARPPRLAIERSVADGRLGFARVRREVEAAPLLVCEEFVPRRGRGVRPDGKVLRAERPVAPPVHGICHDRRRGRLATGRVRPGS